MMTPMQCYFLKKKRDMPEVFSEWMDPAQSAVISIDMHRGHLGDETNVTCPAPRGKAIIERHNWFCRVARRCGVPVIHVQLWLRADGIDDVNGISPSNWRFLYEAYIGPNENQKNHSLEGTPWLDLMVETEPSDYYVRTKKRLSAFYPTDLEYLLRNLDKKNVVIVGAYTDCCDLCSAFDAANRMFRVVVPQDVTAGYSPEAEEAALFLISLHAGVVVDSDDLVAEWYARCGIQEPARFQAG